MVAAMLVDRTSAARAGAAGNAIRPWCFTIAKTLHSLPVWARRIRAPTQFNSQIAPFSTEANPTQAA